MPSRTIGQRRLFFGDFRSSGYAMGMSVDREYPSPPDEAPGSKAPGHRNREGLPRGHRVRRWILSGGLALGLCVAVLIVWALRGGNGAGHESGLALERTVFHETIGLDPVTDVFVGRNEGSAAVFACEHGAIVRLGPAGGILGRIAVAESGEPCRRVVRAVDLDADGGPEFLAIGCGGLAGIGPDGRETWSYRHGPAMGWAAVDLDRDGQREIVLAGETGLIVLSRGKRTAEWPAGAGAWGVCALEGADERAEIVAGVGNELLRFDAEGRLLGRRRPGHVPRAPLRTVHWPGPRGRPAVLAAGPDDTTLVLSARQGAVLTVLPRPWPYHARAVWARLKHDNPPFLVVHGFRPPAAGKRRASAVLIVYDASGRVVHDQHLPGRGGGLAVLPGPDGRDSVLVGGAGKVWRFHAASD